MIVCIVCDEIREAKVAAATITEALIDIGDYHFVKARVSRTELGHKIELTFRPQER